MFHIMFYLSNGFSCKFTPALVQLSRDIIVLSYRLHVDITFKRTFRLDS